jgi:AraC-like DNA-binding protein
MPSSTLSTFCDPDEFESALLDQVDVDLLVTGQGKFRCRLTQVALNRLYLAVGDEEISRIAFLSMRPNLVLVWWTIDRHSSQIWCGVPTPASQIMTLGPGDRAHARTEGACRWAGVCMPAAVLSFFSQALTGNPFTVPEGANSWSSGHTALRTLRSLHAAAIKTLERRPSEVLTANAIHGLEQQLIHALVECLPEHPTGASSNATRKRSSSMMASFEHACASYVDRMPTLVEICTALDVPERTLRTSCKQYLGMGPMNYIRLRRMNLVRRALRTTHPAGLSVSEVASRYGFVDMRRFAARYRKLFGEFPSTTLRRSAGMA